MRSLRVILGELGEATKFSSAPVDKNHPAFQEALQHPCVVNFTLTMLKTLVEFGEETTQREYPNLSGWTCMSLLQARLGVNPIEPEHRGRYLLAAADWVRHCSK